MRQNWFIFVMECSRNDPKSFPQRRMKSSSRHTRFSKPTAAFASAGTRRGMGGVTEDRMSMVQLFAYRRSLRVFALALCSLTLAVDHPPASARPIMASATRACGHYAGHHARHSVQHHHRHASAAVALGAASRRCRRAVFGEGQCRPYCLRSARSPRPTPISNASGRLRLIRHRLHGAPLSRRQSYRPLQPVVRALHEHGAAADRPSAAPAPTWRARSPDTASASPGRRSAPSP